MKYSPKFHIPWKLSAIPFLWDPIISESFQGVQWEDPQYNVPHHSSFSFDLLIEKDEYKMAFQSIQIGRIMGVWQIDFFRIHPNKQEKKT